MSKLKQLIGLQTSNLSVRELARALGLSIGAVSKYQRAVRAAGIGAAEAENLSEAELEQRVFGPAQPVKAGALVAPDCAWIHNELKRHRHVTSILESGRDRRPTTSELLQPGDGPPRDLAMACGARAAVTARDYWPNV